MKNFFNQDAASATSEEPRFETAAKTYAPVTTFGRMNAQYEVPLTAEMLRKYGIDDIADIGVRTEQNYNDVTQQTDVANKYYNKKTGANIGTFGGGGLGDGVLLTQDAQGNFRAVKPQFGDFFEELGSGVKDLVTDPGFALMLAPILGVTGAGAALGSAIAPSISSGAQAALGSNLIRSGIGLAAGQDPTTALGSAALSYLGSTAGGLSGIGGAVAPDYAAGSFGPVDPSIPVGGLGAIDTTGMFPAGAGAAAAVAEPSAFSSLTNTLGDIYNQSKPTLDVIKKAVSAVKNVNDARNLVQSLSSRTGADPSAIASFLQKQAGPTGLAALFTGTGYAKGGSVQRFDNGGSTGSWYEDLLGASDIGDGSTGSWYEDLLGASDIGGSGDTSPPFAWAATGYDDSNTTVKMVNAPDIWSKAKDFLTNKQLGNISGAGLLAGIGGIAGLLKLIDSEKGRYGVPGREDWQGPLQGYKFDAAKFTPTSPNPADFRPKFAGGGIVALADGGPVLYSPFEDALAHPETIPRLSDETVEQAKARLQSWKDEWEHRVRARLKLSGVQVPDKLNVQQTPASITAMGPMSSGTGPGSLSSYAASLPAATPSASFGPAPAPAPAAAPAPAPAAAPTPAPFTTPVLQAAALDPNMFRPQPGTLTPPGTGGVAPNPNFNAYTPAGWDRGALANYANSSWKDLIGLGGGNTRPDRPMPITDGFGFGKPGGNMPPMNPVAPMPTDGTIPASWARPMPIAQEELSRPYAAGGETSSKPKYTSKAALKAMTPWQRAMAEMNNMAAVARMPQGMQLPDTNMQQLGAFAKGGGISDLGAYSDGGRMLKGPGDGMSDNIPGVIGHDQPARLADGEFVIPADVVSGLGNGSTDAGAKQLYKMLDRVRTARTGTKEQGRQINPTKFMPA